MYAIGDVAGQYDALIKLVDKLPKKDKPIILLGDLNDRGWKSKDVIQWAIDNDVDNGGRVTTLDSNHGDMFVDWYNAITRSRHDYNIRYDDGIFFSNGGRATVSSYNIDFTAGDITKQVNDNDTMLNHIEWLSLRPSNIKIEVNGHKYLLTHAPLNINPHRTLEQFFDVGTGFANKPYFFRCDSEYNYQWNRYEPDRFHHELPDTISVFGHNSVNTVKLFCKQYPDGIYAHSQDTLKELVDINKNQIYGIGIDTSKVNKITALDLESFDYFQESYL